MNAMTLPAVFMPKRDYFFSAYGEERGGRSRNKSTVREYYCLSEAEQT